MTVPCTHFVGFNRDFNDSRVQAAMRVFGVPDFWHRHYDRRVPGDVAPGDTVVFAKGDEFQPFQEYSYDDSGVM